MLDLYMVGACILEPNQPGLSLGFFARCTFDQIGSDFDIIAHNRTVLINPDSSWVWARSRPVGILDNPT